MADKKKWLQILAFVTDSINQGLLLRNEYTVSGRAPAEIGKRLGRKALQEIACIAKPGTILA